MAGHSTAEVRVVREHRLRPPRDRKILFEMAVTPDQAVISFIANAEGKWRLSRVRRWLDKEPEEQTITVPGLVLGDRKQWAPWSAKLEVTPDGKFAICVTSAFRVGPAGPRSRRICFRRQPSRLQGCVEHPCVRSSCSERRLPHLRSRSRRTSNLPSIHAFSETSGRRR